MSTYLSICLLFASLAYLVEINESKMSDPITILHGDCRVLMQGIPPCSVDCILTDPPFGTEISRDGYGRRQNYGGVGRAIAGDASLEAFSEMLDDAGRVLAPKAWLAVFCSPKRHAETAGILELHGFPVVGEVVWDKASPGLGGGIRYQHETILLSKRGDIPGRNSLLSVLRAFVPREGKHKRHPHEKPVDVLSKLICYCSLEGQLVLDPFVGSGSTLVSCLKTGREGIGMEIDPEWIPTIHRRVSEARTPLFSTAEAF